MAQFDPEDRLTQTGPADFDASYDGDGLRASKTVSTSSPATTYYLYDGGTPIIEETFSGTSASFSALNGWTADGWRARKQGGIVYQFVYDPQGSVQQRHTDGAYSSGLAAYDRSTFEGYGALRGAYKGSTGSGVGQHDPAGFGGQFGYYTDTETGLLCLTHRYYDPGTGKFLNRDPIGYGGGMNLYGFAEGNPVNESDPSGFDPNDTNGGVGHLLPNANSEYSDGYQQFTQGQVPEYGDNYHGMARVGGGQSPIEAVGGWLSRLFHSGGRPSRRMQRGMVMTPGGRPSRLSDRVTKALPEGEGRSPAENVQARNYFERNRELARKRWSERTEQPWPANTTHDEHPRPLKDGGDPLFIEPGFDGPANPHKGRDFSRWGKLGGRPRKNR